MENGTAGASVRLTTHSSATDPSIMYDAAAYRIIPLHHLREPVDHSAPLVETRGRAV